MKVLYDLDELEQVVGQCWNEFQSYKIWAMHGDMGVGKTTFTNMLCKNILQCEDNISSPTFAIINQYISPIIGTISHIDLYRLKGEEDAVNAGVEDAIYASKLSIVEWPEIAPELLEKEITIHLYFSVHTDGKRILEVRKDQIFK
ncbi:tRNA (adenosine(37)-N6)-threonylcarbamoyltransferase complex ATPase subunit type 1 TsaE [Rhizosphaericola mali]|uniref:tRNA threonylcarbamoyladenosine biosynthesis protein TsaE n=1 Tax=Rhizosphaericola mali TaxID=2545455 RepID=A0A5P2G7E9_9BACT|nr:tRNA (adenosine(37)-N6)-threonylcarbamoyltransferase complex ATPase subunit type 1 TsaE [Rhizosphaericola mali]QES90199.1 tRNA (adenosine(37)-N6)-threonylcarbamoyltransferase complex ATPase subunit type 1 TsaE [Rhizosphaericola mali]